jgi:hypothetical protein
MACNKVTIRTIVTLGFADIEHFSMPEKQLQTQYLPTLRAQLSCFHPVTGYEV